MHKIVVSLALASFLIQVNAQELNTERLQLVAKDVDTKNNIITATGDVVAYSPTYYLSSDKMIFFCLSVFFNAFSLNFGSLLLIRSKYSTGTTCHDKPNLSLHHPQELSCPPFAVNALQ